MNGTELHRPRIAALISAYKKLMFIKDDWPRCALLQRINSHLMEKVVKMADETLEGLKVAILRHGWLRGSGTYRTAQSARSSRRRHTRCLSQGRRGARLNFTDWGQTLPVDLKLDDARPQDFDALLLPGGVINPDKLRIIPAAVAFREGIFRRRQTGGGDLSWAWTIIEADKARGRRMTSWPSVRTDLKNAGADVVDREAVVDDNLLTSRQPDDIPAFNREMIKLFGGARGQRQAA